MRSNSGDEFFGAYHAGHGDGDAGWLGAAGFDLYGDCFGTPIEDFADVCDEIISVVDDDAVSHFPNPLDASSIGEIGGIL